MDESFFREPDIYQESDRIIEAISFLSKLDLENFENVTLFFQNSIFVTSKKLLKSLIRSLLNVIRFRTKKLDLYANLCINLKTISGLVPHILIKFLKNADSMTPSQFKFYRLCMSKNLISSFDVIKQISPILYFNITERSSVEHLIPLFLWFLPEFFRYSNNIFRLFYEKLQKLSDNKRYLNQIKLLKYNDWFLFYQYAENQYINLRFYHAEYDKNEPIKDNPPDTTDLTKKSIEFSLREDDVDQLQQLTENINLNQSCNISLFDLLLPVSQHPTLTQFAAVNASVKCFKFLLVNNANMSTVVPSMSTSHLLTESLHFNQQIQNQGTKIIQNNEDTNIKNSNSDENEPEVIEIGSSSSSESESEPKKEAMQEASNESTNKSDDDDVIFIDDSESNEEEKETEPKRKSDQDDNLKISKSGDKEIIIIDDSSSEDESKQINTNKKETRKDNQEENSKSDKIEKFPTINLSEIEEKKSRYFIPQVYLTNFTNPVDPPSIKLAPRSPLCIEYASSMKIATTPQYAIAGGNNEIIRLIYNADLSFIDTPRIAVSCFFNDIAKWLLDVVLSTDENDNSESNLNRQDPQNFSDDHLSLQFMYSNLLHHSITTGNLEMMKYIILNMPNEINDKLNTLNFVPLHLAIKYHQIDVLSFLLNLKSIDVNNIDKNTNKTPFFMAVDQKSLTMIKMIASHPFFDFNQISYDTLKPIHYVALYGTTKMLKYFISLSEIDVNDNVIYKIEEERVQIAKRKKKNKKKKAKKSKNFLHDEQFLFFIEEKNNKKEEKNEEEEEEEETEDSKSSENGYYYKYTHELYDSEYQDIKIGKLVNTPIVCALLTEKIEKILILANDKNLQINTKSDQMPLHLCIIRDNLSSMFDYLLSNREKNKIDIDAYDRCGTTPLHYAIIKKKMWAIEALIKAGCDVTKRTICEGDTVLHLAAFSGYYNAFKKFITMKEIFDVNITNYKNQTILHYATIYGATKIVDELFSIPGIDVNARDIDGNTSLHHAIQNSKLHIFESLLSNHSIDVNAMNNDSETPLIFAFKFQNIEAIKKLLSLNGTINPNCFESGTLNTPLHLAVLLKDQYIIKLLFKLHNRVCLNRLNEEKELEDVNFYKNSFQYEFEGETDVNCQNIEGSTALHLAVKLKDDMIVRTLLNSPKIKLDIVDNTLRRCPLHYAALGNIESPFVMKFLNPYMYNTTRFSNTIFMQLISRDPLTGNIQDANGDTAFHIALNETGFEGIILKNTAIQLNKKSSSFKTNSDNVIVIDDDDDDDDVLKLNLKNNKGETYLHLAAASGNRIVLEFMLKTHPELINEKTVDVLFLFF
ncbi:hypothetical protein M9Y10_002462 [Tritrichomonas musculus]|uniref:DUF3447 domain-containing protein n=1 Tax=Tritrichomonas musculus TaxID=1915356 RepID=A0ABR2LA04_9EUKA